MLTHQLFKTRASSCQKQVGIPSQMPTYKLFKIQSMFLSGTSSKGQPDADLQSVQNPEHALVRHKQEGPARFCLTSCSNPGHALLRNKQDSPARHLLTSCSKPRAWSCQIQAGRASQILPYILFKPRACSSQKQAGQPSQTLTYKLFKTQSMLFSATSRKVQPYADLHTGQNTKHALVSIRISPSQN